MRKGLSSSAPGPPAVVLFARAAPGRKLLSNHVSPPLRFNHLPCAGVSKP